MEIVIPQILVVKIFFEFAMSKSKKFAVSKIFKARIMTARLFSDIIKEVEMRAGTGVERENHELGM